MRQAVITVLKALLNGEEVNVARSLELQTTRLPNEIGLLRDNGIQIDMIRVPTQNGKWYGNYRLVRNEANLRKAREFLAAHTASGNDKPSDQDASGHIVHGR